MKLPFPWSRVLPCLLLSLLLVPSAGSADVPYADRESLRVIGSSVIMRAQPHQSAPVVRTMDEYDHLTFLGEYTVEPITVSVRGESRTEPFLKVRADNGDEGWVFGGLVASDSGANLLAEKLPLLSAGDTVDEIIHLYGRDYVTHDHRMTSSSTRALLEKLGTDQAWEFYYFRAGEGVAFGLEDEEIQSILVRQDVFGDSLETYWRTVEGYLTDDLRPECHETPDSSSCDDYLL